MDTFTGFSPQTLDFFAGLGANNNKPWFEANRAIYEAHVLDPAKRFVAAMGQVLPSLSPDIQAVPQANGSIFRIHRDTRFSADKTPYKTALGIFFWEGTRPKMECPGYYLHIEPGEVMLGVGLWMFPKEQLAAYRDAVVHPVLGAELVQAVAAVRAFAGPGSLSAAGCGGTIESYKKVPAGYDPNHPNAEFLKYKGLHAGITTEIPPEFTSGAFVDWCLTRYAGMAPLHRWMVKMGG